MRSNKAIAQNTAVQTIGKMLAVIFGIFTVGIFARHLGASGYGQLSTVLGYLSVFAVIVDFGLTLTTVQMISEDEDREERLIGNLMTLRVISAIGFLALAPITALAFPSYDQVMIIGIAVGAVSYLFGTTAQMLVGIFQKRLVMGRVVVAELLNRTVVLVGAILAPALGLGLVGIVWLLVLGNLGQLIATLAFAKKFVSIRFKIDFELWKRIIQRSWPIGASIFFNLIYLRGDIVFLSWFRSFEEIGQYGAAYKVVDVITVVPVMYMGLVLPMLIASWSSGKKKEFKQSIQDAFDFFSIAAVPFAVGSVLLGVPVIELIAGREFTEGGRVLAVLGPAASVVFFNSLFGHAIVGVNKQKPMTLGYLFVAIVTVTGYLTFIPKYGIWAAAWWTLIAEIMIGLITFAVVARVTRFVPNLNMFVRASFASIVMLICLLLLPAWHVLVLIAVGSVVYYITLAAVGGPKLKDAVKLFLPEKPPIAAP